MMQYGMPVLIENKTTKETAEPCRSLGLQFVEMNMSSPE